MYKIDSIFQTYLRSFKVSRFNVETPLRIIQGFTNLTRANFTKSIKTVSTLPSSNHTRKTMNILVYTGEGTTPHSVKQTLESLRRHLSPTYVVIPVSLQLLSSEPWESKTSLVVIPGGADSSIVRDFRSQGVDKKIKEWVRRSGGRYLGLCSGGYYGSNRCEFEVGNLQMEVSGPRELGFFPGIARGSALKGFQYGSEDGARAVPLRVNPELEGYDESEAVNYYNGGAVFVDAEKFPGKVEVLAEYGTPIDVDFGSVTPAAIVYCKVGEGCAILTGTHPEFVPELLQSDPSHDSKYNLEVVDVLKKYEIKREKLMKALLMKLGLKVNEIAIAQPHLTPLLLTSPIPNVVSSIVNDIVKDIGVNEQDGLIHGSKDQFNLKIGSSSELNYLDTNQQQSQGFEDPATVVKQLYAFTDDSDKLIPERKLTPYFDIQAYFRVLKDLHGALTPGSDSLIPGSALLYAEVITSTSMILNENLNLLRQVPSGTLVTASVQVSGRGRGGNVWVNPHGVLASSLVLDLPFNLKHAPVVFVQYLAALAVVEAVKGAGEGYSELPIGIKWPNDVYCVKPENFGKERDIQDSDSTHVKICGILVNTNVIDGKYKLIIGTGINLDNEAPTTSINSTIKLMNVQRHSQGLQPLALLSPEELLARYVHSFSKLYTTFVQRGFGPLLHTYYSHWFHSGQVVRLQDHGNTRARIVGITDDWGLLDAVEVDMQNKTVLGGKRFFLQPDGNSFDMFKGLISKKV